MDIAFLNHSISRNAGGVFEIERRLAQCLINIRDVNVKIIGLKDNETENDLNSWLPFRPEVHEVVGPHSFGYAPDLVASLKKSNADLLHLHVLWLYPSIASLRANVPYITTINGMLDEWAVKNSSFKKKIVGALYEKAALKKAGCLQENTIKEYDDIRKFGLKKPVCIIPNGVDLPENIDQLKEQAPIWNGVIESHKKVLLYLGRIHPKKGLTNLLKAWKQIQLNRSNGYQEWDLVIAGWNQGNHEEELKQLTKELAIQGNVHFLGPQFNENKQLAFAHADAFILPSFSEGLPMAVLEAWSFNLPVLMTDACNLPEGFQSGAALQIRPSAESITEGLDNLFSCSVHEMQKMGAAGKKLVTEKFNWNAVASQMHKVYQWVLEKDILPENVILT
jgi:poly(glycerol-phosphate) alpha-glucosyltransferase